jgi:hypothetical protein
LGTNITICDRGRYSVVWWLFVYSGMSRDLAVTKQWPRYGLTSSWIYRGVLQLSAVYIDPVAFNIPSLGQLRSPVKDTMHALPQSMWVLVLIGTVHMICCLLSSLDALEQGHPSFSHSVLMISYQKAVCMQDS